MGFCTSGRVFVPGSVVTCSLLPSRDGDGQSVLFWWEWACCIRTERAGRVVGAVEVQHHVPTRRRRGIQKAARAVRLGSVGEVGEDEEEIGLALLQHRREPELL